MMTAIQALFFFFGLGGASPLLVLTGTAGGPGAPTLEAEFCTELSLLVESHPLHIQASFSFNSNAQLDRIEQLRPIVDAIGAEVVIWIERTAQNQYALQLLSVAPGRAISRTAVVSPSPSAASELAIAATELLHDIYLRTGSSPAAAQSPPPEDAPEPVSSVSVARSLSGAIGVGAGTAIGLVGEQGPSVGIGGDLLFILALKSGFFFNVSAGGFVTPAVDVEPSTLKSGGFRVGGGGGWLRTNGVFSMGPSLSLEAVYTQTAIAYPGRDETVAGFWRLRIAPALETRFRIARKFGIGVGTGVGISPNQVVFENEVGDAVYATPFLDWFLCLLFIADVF